MTIPVISRTNTVDEWRIQTNQSANQLNTIESGAYIKNNGTFTFTNTSSLILTSQGTSLQVSNSALIQRDVTIGNELDVGVQSSSTGNVVVGNSIVVLGRGSALQVANNALINVDLQVQQTIYTGNVRANGILTVNGNETVNGILRLEGTGDVLYVNSGSSYVNTANIQTLTSNSISAAYVTAQNEIVTNSVITDANIVSANIQTLGVTGNQTVSGNLSVTQNTTSGNLTTSGTARAGSLVVSNSGTVGGALSVTGNVSSGNLVSGGLTHTQSLRVADFTTLNTLSAGVTTLQNATIVNNLEVQGNFTVIGASLIDTNIITLRSSTPQPNGSGFSYFGVNRGNTSSVTGTANANAYIRWSEPIYSWEVRDVLNTNDSTAYSKILTANLVSNSLSSISTETIASSNAVNTLNNLIVTANNSLKSYVDSNISTLTISTASASSYANGAFAQANTARLHANAAFNAANNATDTWVRNAANSASSYANSAYIHANSAFAAANSAVDTWVRNAANSASSYANSAFSQANTALANANTALVNASSAGSFANGAFARANTAQFHANEAFNTANSVSSSATSAGSFANGAFAQANTARLHANAAFNLANTRYSASGGTISGDVTVTGNLTVSGTTTTINTQELNVADNIIVLNSDVSPSTTPSENAGVEVNRGSSSRVSIVWNETTDRWTFTNDGSSFSNIGSSASESYANSAFDQANTGTTLAQASFDYANTVNGVVVATNRDQQMNSLGVGIAPSGIAGEILALDNITAYASSDRRLKENVVNIPNALEKVLKLNGVEYDWVDAYIQERGGEDDYFVRKHDIGLIAQEVEEVLPEIVADRPNGYKAIKYERVVALLVEAIKELQKQIDNLKRE